MLFGRSLCKVFLEAHWSATTLWLRFNGICISFTLKHIANSLFFFLNVIKFHYTHGITKSVVDFLLLVSKLINDSEVCFKIRVLTLSYEIIDDRCLLLAIAVNTPISLFECNKTPRNVVIEHDMAEVVKVNTLATTIT